METDEEALEEVCGWLSSEAGLRTTVVAGARELMRKEEVYDVQDLADLGGLGSLEQIFPARVTRLKVERALQRRLEQGGASGARQGEPEPAKAEGEAAEEGEPAWLLKAGAVLASGMGMVDAEGADEVTPEAAPLAPRKPRPAQPPRALRELSFAPPPSGTSPSTAAARIQAAWRGRRARTAARDRAEAARVVQAAWRGTACRRWAACEIQAAWRGTVCRRWAPHAPLIPGWFWGSAPHGVCFDEGCLPERERPLGNNGGEDIPAWFWDDGDNNEDAAQAEARGPAVRRTRGDKGSSDAEPAPELDGARADGGGDGAKRSGFHATNPPEQATRPPMGQCARPLAQVWASAPPDVDQTLMRFDDPSSACGLLRPWLLSMSKVKIDEHMRTVPVVFRVFRFRHYEALEAYDLWRGGTPVDACWEGDGCLTGGMYSAPRHG